MSLLGQPHIEKALRDAASAGALHHACLFAGPPGSGRHAAVTWLAQMANCEAEPGVRPCGECRQCRLAAAGSHPDVSWVVPGEKSKTGKIIIEQAQDARTDIARRPVMGRHKILVLDPADEMTLEAANCLLKTLEEPPANALIALLVSDTGNVIPTVLSRCQVFRLRPVPAADIATLLEAEGAEPETARRLAALADGRPGEALRLFRDPTVMEKRERALDWLEDVAAAPFGEALRLAHILKAGTEGAGADVPETLLRADGWFRDILLLQSGADPGGLANPDREHTLRRAAGAYPPDQAQAAPRAIRDARRRLAGNATPQLVLDNLVMDLVPRGSVP